MADGFMLAPRGSAGHDETGNSSNVRFGADRSHLAPCDPDKPTGAAWQSGICDWARRSGKLTEMPPDPFGLFRRRTPEVSFLKSRDRTGRGWRS